MNIDGLAVLGLFIVMVIVLAIWNTQSKYTKTIPSEVRDDSGDWSGREN